MADPLSVGSGIVTLICACTAIGKCTVSFIGALRDAPSELLMLSNEVNDLNVILSEIYHSSSANTEGQNTIPSTQPNALMENKAVVAQVRHLKEQIIELNDFVMSLRRQSPDSGSVDIDRLGWGRKKKLGLRLQRKLAETKHKFHFLLDATTASRTCQIQSLVQRDTIDATQHRKRNDAQLDLILAQLTRLVTHPQAQVEELDEGSQPPTPIVVEHNNSAEDNTHSQFQDLVHQAWNISETPADATVATLQFQPRTLEICEDSCNCICHLRDRSWWRSPLILRNVVGFFFLGYSGLSFLKPACNSIGCRSHSSQRFKVTYCVPRWLLTKAVHVATRMTPYGDIFLTLTIQARTDEFAFNSIYHLAQRNNIKGIENVLERRMASPNDADQRAGVTPLHFAVNGRKVEATRLLLARGANSALEDDSGVTAVQAAWDQIYYHRQDSQLPEDLQGLTQIFPEYRSMDSFDFSRVHKVVLNIYPLSLERVLLKETWRSQKDFSDSWGRTPLHWATRRGDVAAIEALIYAGVNVDAQDHKKQAPLHFAAYNPSEKCLQLLLQAKANPIIKDDSGAEPIHYASMTGLAHLQALVMAGSSLERETTGRGRPLGWAACGNNVIVGKYLIDEGVEKDHADTVNGDTALFSAISSCSTEFLDMLLDEGVNIKHINKHGSTILHWTARCADRPVLDTLAARLQQLKSLNTTHRDHAGHTAREVLHNRVEVPTGFSSAFEQFISTLEELQLDRKPEYRTEEPNGTRNGGEVIGVLWSFGVVVICLAVGLTATVLAFNVFLFD